MVPQALSILSLLESKNTRPEEEFPDKLLVSQVRFVAGPSARRSESSHLFLEASEPTG